MSEIPESWLATTLGEVLDYGATVKTEPDEIPDDAWILELEDIEKDSSKLIRRFTFSERRSKSTKNRFSKGDVLYGKLRPYLNKVIVADADGYCTTEIIPIRPAEITDNRFLFYWLKHPTFVGYATDVSHGLNMPRLGTDAGKNAPFVLAPRLEQKRIADKLDVLLARVDACRERLHLVPVILKRFRQSVLAAAIRGELTREWREERGGAVDAHSWLSTSLVDLCVPSRVITYGVIKLGEETRDGVPCLRTSNVRWLQIDTEGMKRIAPALSAEFGRTVLQGGEVLVNVRGTLGGVAVVESTMRGWNVSREVAVVPVDQDRVNSHFLAFWIGSDDGQRWLSRVEKGVAYTGINIEDLRELPVSVPPMEEQNEVVRRVQSLLAAADELERRHAVIARATAHLTSSVLAKAFRGELVPQDSTEEPASALLAKLKATQTRFSANASNIRLKKPGKRTRMNSSDKNSIKGAILKMKTDRFSFDDLRAQVSGDYELLKTALFELLEEPSPVVRQVFDKKAKAMQLERVSP